MISLSLGNSWFPVHFFRLESFPVHTFFIVSMVASVQRWFLFSLCWSIIGFFFPKRNMLFCVPTWKQKQRYAFWKRITGRHISRWIQFILASWISSVTAGNAFSISICILYWASFWSYCLRFDPRRVAVLLLSTAFPPSCFMFVSKTGSVPF